MLLDPAEESRVGDQPVLDHLGQPGAQFAHRQRRQRADVRDDGPRLVEGADQVLAAWVVDPGLAADRGVHLREQRRRHLHVVHASLVAGRRETGDVADDPAAERRHASIPVHPVLDERVEDARQRVEGLVLLAVRQHDGRDSLAGQRAAEPVEVQGGHRFIGDHEDVACRHGFGEDGRIVEQRGTDQDRVAALAELDAQAVHHAVRAASRRRTISSTTVLTLRPSVSTVRSADSS